MKSHKGNKKRSNNRTKKFKYSARLIKLDNEGNTLVIFNKNVPKNTVKKVFNNVNKSKLCKEMTGKRKLSVGGTRKRKRGSKKFIGGSAEAIAGVGKSKFTTLSNILSNVSGPIGGFSSGGTFLFKLMGGPVGALITGGTLATLMYALKKVKIKPVEDKLTKVEIDYINNKYEQSKVCMDPTEMDFSKMQKPWSIEYHDCNRARPRKGTNSIRKEVIGKIEEDEREKERAKRRQEDIKEMKASATKVYEI